MISFELNKNDAIQIQLNYGEYIKIIIKIYPRIRGDDFINIFMTHDDDNDDNDDNVDDNDDNDDVDDDNDDDDYDNDNDKHIDDEDNSYLR